MDKPMNSHPCPNLVELSQFALGNLPRAEFDRVAHHVEECLACESALQEFDSQSDSLVGYLKGGKVRSPEVSAKVLDAAHSIGAKNGEAARLASQSLRRIGKFELLGELGLGSFGQVFRAWDTELGRTVAVKILRAGWLASREEVERFHREARSAAQLKHPGLVAIYETGQTDDHMFYLVEEFVPGETLAARLRTDPPTIPQTAELIAQVAEALDYAHRHRVIHRDIKPSNILLDREGRAHLMDFGLAKRDTDETPVTLDGDVLGTPAYMSPEQARGESRQVDPRSDIYSLGVVTYELLTGERPFRGSRRMLLLQVLNDEPRPPRQLNDKVPRDLQTICLKAMAKAPSSRYASAAELSDDLRRFLRGDPILARPPGRLERLGRWCRRNPVAVGLFVAVTIGSAFGLWHLSRLSEQLVHSTALTSAGMQVEMLEKVNSRYSLVVDRIGPHGIEATHDYQNKKAAVPIPATFLTEVGEDISQSESGMLVRHYSDTPFPSRKDGGPKDDLEREALDRLRDRPDDPFYRFEEYQNRPVLRYFAARRMQASCVECHNKHSESPKKDWKEGDVGGVLEIIRPLDSDVARTRQGLRGTFLLMAGISGSLLSLSVLVLFVGNRRHSHARYEKELPVTLPR